MANMNAGMTAYDLAQQERANVGPLKETVKQEIMTEIGAWFSSKKLCKYYMLLNRELSDYTVFNFINPNYSKSIQELEEVCAGRGYIQEIEYNHNTDYYEIWIKYVEDDISHMYILFSCDDFIIEI